MKNEPNVKINIHYCMLYLFASELDYVIKFFLYEYTIMFIIINH